MQKIIPNKSAIKDSYPMFETVMRDISNGPRPFMAIRVLIALMDGRKTREELAEFIDDTSNDFKNKGNRDNRKLSHTLANLTHVVKWLHEFELIRIFYDHPKHTSPCSDTGRLRPGVKVSYALTELSNQFLRGWIYRCFTAADGPFYPSSPPENGELIRDSKGNLYIHGDKEIILQ